MQVTIAFDPSIATSRPAREFLAMVKKPSVRTSHPRLTTHEVLRSDGGASLVVVDYEHGDSLAYRIDELSMTELLTRFRSDAKMAVIRGFLHRAGLKLEDMGTPGFPRVYVSPDVRKDPEVKVVDTPDDSNPNDVILARKRAQNPMKASKANPQKASARS